MSQIANVSTEVSSTRPTSRWFDVHPTLGISMIDHLYNRLDGAYPKQWRAQFPSPQAIKNWEESWVEAFEESGITPELVAVGLKVCRTRNTWPPTCTEFVQACKPSVDAVAAYHEAVAGLMERGKGQMGTWSHPAIFWAASMLKGDLKMQTYAQVKTRWEVALRSQLERTEWAEIQMPRIELPAPGQGRLSKEQAGELLRQLNATGITKRPTAGFNHKRWAHRIMERAARGDNSLCIHQINSARAALEQTE